MLSPLSNSARIHNPTQTYHHFPTSNYSVVKRNFLSKGGIIEDAAEFNYVVWQEGARSILSLLDPNKPQERCILSSELRHINRHNLSYPEHKVTFDSLPVWSSRDLRSNLTKLKALLAEKINSLPKPIYIHCYLGKDLSEQAGFHILEAIKEGKIRI